MKVLINRCYGGFGLSQEVLDRYKEIAGEEYDFSLNDRTDPILIGIVEEFLEKGINVDDYGSDIYIVEIPDDVVWEIHDYDGIETVREVSREWG